MLHASFLSVEELLNININYYSNVPTFEFASPLTRAFGVRSHKPIRPLRLIYARHLIFALHRLSLELCTFS